MPIVSYLTIEFEGIDVSLISDEGKTAPEYLAIYLDQNPSLPREKKELVLSLMRIQTSKVAFEPSKTRNITAIKIILLGIRANLTDPYDEAEIQEMLELENDFQNYYGVGN